MAVTYISWAPHCSRSDYTARELGGTSHMVYWGALGSRPATVWLKYFGQACSTWRILLRERPHAVVVMSPPVFAALSVWFYCLLRGTPFAIDAHTAAFLDRRWRRFQWLQRFLSTKAVVTLVTNDHLAGLVRDGGGESLIVPDVPVHFPRGAYHLEDAFNIAVVCSFNPDEPVRQIAEAAALVPDVVFHVTGDSARWRDRPPALPPNIRLTGFLSVGEYGALLRGADAVMALTTRDHTMLRGAWEAVYQGTPIIVSDWALLKESFADGGVFVANTPPSIASGINRLRSEYDSHRAGVQRLKARKTDRWRATRDKLRAMLRLETAPF
jgi:glycosyltransferase involved in cell wall biosynthesis